MDEEGEMQLCFSFSSNLRAKILSKGLHWLASEIIKRKVCDEKGIMEFQLSGCHYTVIWDQYLN